MRSFLKIYSLAAIFGGFALLTGPVVAQQSSAPKSSIPNLAKFAAPPTNSKKIFSHSTVSLLNGGFKDGAWQVGVEIKMAKGWKTYWLVPGDAGVPPE